ncbi:hypothetical protein l11_13550 [Neisseria weaveri LMG 5135]|nr:hypothetical protein l11_13550 [Neisseria weaveri LMG 5135]
MGGIIVATAYSEYIGIGWHSFDISALRMKYLLFSVNKTDYTAKRRER